MLVRSKVARVASGPMKVGSMARFALRRLGVAVGLLPEICRCSHRESEHTQRGHSCSVCLCDGFERAKID